MATGFFIASSNHYASIADFSVAGLVDWRLG